MNKLYFFNGTQYSRYDVNDDAADSGYPIPIAGNWPGLPASGIDAAINWGNGKTFFFSGSIYYRFDNKANRVDAGYPRAIAGNWPGLTLDRVDACVNWGNGKAYFFRGSQYWRYDIKADKTDPTYPVAIAASWKGLFPSDIDGAINWGNGKAYFFKGNQYSRYDIKLDAVEIGWPKLISGQWRGLFNSGVRAPVMLGFAGMDSLGYPGDAVMQQLWNETNLTWTGFYLAPAPSQGSTAWMTRLDFLRGIGWGVAPVYVGQQQPEQNSPGSHNISAPQGTLDAANAILLALSAGYATGSVIYLDIETGGPIQPGLAAYYKSWVQGVITGGFKPGVYCSFLLANQFFALDRRPAFWTFNLSKFANGPTAIYQSTMPSPEPVLSSIENAAVWQLAQNAVLKTSTQTVRPMDFDSCCVRDPSQIG
ncbi:MAG: hemopexin repeat-containing protein [Chitinophagaceae bacterium]